MVIMTAKVSKSKLIAISLLIFVAVILLVLGLSSSARKQAALPEMARRPLEKSGKRRLRLRPGRS